MTALAFCRFRRTRLRRLLIAAGLGGTAVAIPSCLIFQSCYKRYTKGNLVPLQISPSRLSNA
jgi:hypothetical protein